MEMMAMLPSLIGAIGGGMNMINGAPANRVQPGMNSLQQSAALFPAMAGQGYGQIAGMPNIYANTLPQYGDITQGLINNPGIDQALTGANSAASMGTGAGGNFMNLGNFLANMGTSLTPWANNMLQQGNVQNPNGGSLMGSAQGGADLGRFATNNMLGTGSTMQGAGNSILQAGFDPQQALHDRTQHELQEQVRSGQSARGLATSPFGAGLEDKAMRDFNIDWQNNLLSRMATAGQSGGNLLSGGAGMIGQAPGMFSSTGALPYQAGSTILTDILRNMSTGAGGAGLLNDQAGRDITGGASLMGQAPGLTAQSSMLPYMAFNQIGSGQLGALGQYGQQGMNALQQPQMQLQDFFQMLGLGNTGAQVNNQGFANQLQQSNLGFNQGQTQGQNFGQSLAGLGKAFGGTSPFASGAQGGNANGSMFPSASFMSGGMGWG